MVIKRIFNTLPLYITNTSYFQNIDNLIIIQPFCDINTLINIFKNSNK